MALLNSLYSGVTGLRNQQTMLDVIGHNISNVNTIGYKGSRVTFSETFNKLVKSGTNPTDSAGGTNSFQVGLGAKLNSIDRNWSQGTFERTGIETDLALQGPGLFIVKNNGQFNYARSGAFIFDSEGKLVNPQTGSIVQGKNGSNGVIPPGNNLEDIQIDTTLKLPATATTATNWGGNLKSSSATTMTSLINQQGTIETPAATVAAGTYLSTSGKWDGGTTQPTNGFTQKLYNKYGDEFTLHTFWKTTAAANTFDVEFKIVDMNGKKVELDPASESMTGVVFDATGNLTGNGTWPATGKTIKSLDSTYVNTNNINFSFEIPNDGATPPVYNLKLNSSTQLTQSGGLNGTGGSDTGVSGSVVIYDSLGNSHTITLKFAKTTTNNLWDWVASVPDSSGNIIGTQPGTITFSSDGKISSVSPSNATLSFSPGGGASNLNVLLNLGSSVSGITQTSSNSAVNALSQDGSPAATLSNISIDQFGTINGVFTNGKSQSLAQILVATFPNRNGLISVGDNMFQVAANSGEANVSVMGELSNTTVQSQTLEQSNVDLTEEFTKMIVAQRGFQANARVVTVSDSILQELTSIIR